MVAVVNNVTSLSGNGLRDWLLQRISAIVIGAYVIFIIGFILLHYPLDFATWKQLFSHTLMRIVTLIVLLAMNVL